MGHNTLETWPRLKETQYVSFRSWIPLPSPSAWRVQGRKGETRSPSLVCNGVGCTRPGGYPEPGSLYLHPLSNHGTTRGLGCSFLMGHLPLGTWVPTSQVELLSRGGGVASCVSREDQMSVQPGSGRAWGGGGTGASVQVLGGVVKLCQSCAPLSFQLCLHTSILSSTWWGGESPGLSPALPDCVSGTPIPLDSASFMRRR